MAATPSQDLDYHEFKDGDTLPFRNDPTNGFDFKVVKPVIPTERYAADFQGSFILKRISLELSEPGQGIKPQDKQLFLREAKALRHARHRHVIDIAMAFSFEGLTEMYFAIVMDRADGDIQRYLMCQAKLEERQKYIPRWFGCLAEAVTHIHDIGIRHRDIKPANILVKGGSILLADFGISKMGLGKTLSTTVPGWQRGNTPKYAAPEVGDGSTRGRAADIFSLGAVFLEMLVALYEPGNLEPKLADVLVTHASSGFEQIGQSYGKQLGSVQKWMNGLHKQLEVDWHGDILRLCREMMKEEREDRLSAETVRSELSKLSRFDNSPRLCSCQDDTALTEDQKLLDACKRKDGLTDVCSLLHENGKLKNTKGAIHQASARGFDDIVKAFLTHNADLDLRDHSDQTPLHCSAANGHEGVVDLLLEKCAGVTSMDEEKQTPLHCASGSGHLSIVTKLLKADTSGSDTLAQNIYGQTALHLAAKRGYEDVVKALITKMGPKEVAVSDNAGQTALHLAAGFGSQNVVETLLEYAVHTSLINKKNTSGWTALHFAAKGKQSKGGYLEVIRCLLGKGADVTERDYDRKTALDHAEENNHKERVGLLKNAVEKGRDAPGATLAPSALTADIGSMTKQLSQIIQPVRKYSDEDIRLASVKLQGFHPGWERLTRVFMVLYASGLPERSLPEVMDRLTQGNITDYRLPVRASDLSDILQPGILARFEEHQQLVLVDELHLEKLKEHCNLRTDEWEGRIEKMKVVGQGNSGQVYQVRNKDTCDVYALKLIRREGPDRERRAGEELNMLKRIKHDNIVSLVGSFTSPAFIGLLIEPIAECDLAEYLLAAGADPDKRSFLFGFFGCLVDALWYLHNVEYVRHNDIKPGNILVRDGRVFLTDFGISLDWSRTLRSTTWDPSPAMTPMYSAPEVKQDDQSRDSFADIWSLGCVFMELMTVLKGRQVDDIRTHLKQRDPRSMAYSENMLPVRRWIEILREAVGYINNDPLEWISNMLREHPKSRPTAGQLRETLNSTSTLRALFFGPCCRANISTRDEAEIAHLVEEEVEEKVPIEQHTCIAAVAWPGECVSINIPYSIAQFKVFIANAKIAALSPR
jgi:serine/threonine protein kinase